MYPCSRFYNSPHYANTGATLFAYRGPNFDPNGLHHKPIVHPYLRPEGKLQMKKGGAHLGCPRGLQFQAHMGSWEILSGKSEEQDN